jgi:uncharacterized protein (TIRG00374 family)
MKRLGYRFIFRILVTAGTLAWFFSAVRLESLLQKLSRVNWWIVALAFIINTLWMVPSVFRWRLIARSGGYRLPLWASVRHFVIGAFFNAFLPTGNGGDFVRGFLASREHGFPLGGILGTILVERIIGMMVTLCLVIIAGFTFFSRIVMPKDILVSATVLFASASAAGVLLASKKFRSIIKPVLQKVPFGPFRNGARDAAHVMGACRENPRTLGSAVLLTLANQFIPIVSSFVASLAIPDFNAPFYAFLLVMPLSFISVLLPSIGGYGVREAGYILFLGWFGVQAEPAAVFGIIRLLFLWLFAFAGAGLYIFERRDKRKNGILSNMKWMQ